MSNSENNTTEEVPPFETVDNPYLLAPGMLCVVACASHARLIVIAPGLQGISLQERFCGYSLLHRLPNSWEYCNLHFVEHLVIFFSNYHVHVLKYQILAALCFRTPVWFDSVKFPTCKFGFKIKLRDPAEVNLKFWLVSLEPLCEELY